ncbi:MAG: polyprenyl synthetase family protein [Rikenellaceae bacterium]|nr:polyprenyl synthetase family protein [Rikenellaceae bacterium]
MLDRIRKPVEKEMEEFNGLLADCLRNENTSVSSVINYVFEKRGKQMRPLLVLLTAALHGTINRKSYIGAVLAELTHAASLIHDDIIDDAYIRRGKLSVNAIWRSKIAVLTGDYVLARAMSLAVNNNAADLLAVIIDSFEKLSEGELIQMEHASRLDMNEAQYFETINKKTASLLGSCAALGARSVGSSEDNIENMRLFGEYLGMAFQIKDDILDLSRDNNTGKPALKDIKDRKVTLPLLILLNNSDERNKKKIIGLLSGVKYKEENAETIHKMILNSDSIEKTTATMHEFIRKASDIIERYDDSEVKTSLKLYMDFIMERDK